MNQGSFLFIPLEITKRGERKDRQSSLQVLLVVSILSKLNLNIIEVTKQQAFDR